MILTNKSKNNENWNYCSSSVACIGKKVVINYEICRKADICFSHLRISWYRIIDYRRRKVKKHNNSRIYLYATVNATCVQIYLYTQCISF